MKSRALLRVGICVAVLLVPIQLFAVVGPQDVSKTVHNLGSQGIGNMTVAAGETDEVCVFCHTPHNSSGDLPLWNRYSTNTGKSFLMYTSSASLGSAAKANAGLSVNSPSRLCLTCHDGMTALNALVNTAATGGVRPTMAGEVSFDLTGVYGDIAAGTNWGPSLGTNLTNMHPINFNYDSAQAEEGPTGLHPIADVDDDLKFFDDDKNGTSDFLECPTCHDPHVDYGWSGGKAGAPTGTGDLRYRPFLRKPNTSSGLCLTCHNK